MAFDSAVFDLWRGDTDNNLFVMKIITYIALFFFAAFAVFAVLAVRAGAQAEKKMKDIFKNNKKH